jgi:hypothetical protein
MGGQPEAVNNREQTFMWRQEILTPHDPNF